MNNIHSKIACSSLARMFACPGSIDAAAKYPERQASDYTSQGTIEHAEGEEKIGLYLAGEDYEVDGRTPVGQYVNGVVDRLSLYGDPQVRIEERIESDLIPDFGGTADVLVVVESLGLIHIMDYKSGAGIPVEAEGNPQLLAYCLLAREKLFPAAKMFCVSVCQPRTPGPAWQDVVVSLAELNDFEDRLQAMLDGPRTFAAGDHCRFCPAVAYCDEVKGKVREAAAKSDRQVAIDGDALAFVRQYETPIKTYFKAVNEAALAEAELGRKFDGFKVVRSWGNATWVDDEETTLKKLSKQGIGKRIATQAKLMSPTQLKKLGYEEAVESLSHRPMKGFKLVAESARGEAVEFQTPAEVFKSDCDQ